MQSRVVAELVRLEDCGEGTFGVLRLDKRVVCVTLEPPDRENQRNISSIPAKQYLCRRKDSPTFGKTFEVLHVPGRTDVLFHAGNVVEHTRGCILLGRQYGTLKQDRAVLASGAAFKSFMELMHDVGEFHLTITEQF